MVPVILALKLKRTCVTGVSSAGYVQAVAYHDPSHRMHNRRTPNHYKPLILKQPVKSNLPKPYSSPPPSAKSSAAQDQIKRVPAAAKQELSQGMAEEEEQVFDFGSKKKKKTKDKKEKADKDEGAKEEGEVKLQGVEGWTQGELHPYKDLLERLYKIIEEHNPEVGNKERYILKPPQVVRVGSKKVAWVNFSEICSMMKRPVDHVVQFVLAEFGTEGSVAGSATTRAEGQGQDGQLVLKGRYQPKHCESLLRKYIKEYVTCEMCKSASTTLRKDPSTRLTMVECSKCGATRTAASIKAGFHAVTRGDRKAAKQLK